MARMEGRGRSQAGRASALTNCTAHEENGYAAPETLTKKGGTGETVTERGALATSGVGQGQRQSY